MNKGDHLISYRMGYEHHGLYLGDGKVIHYAGFARDFRAGKIEVTRLADFANGNVYKVKEHPAPRFNIEERIARAMSRLGEDDYHLVFNNCEHFIHWCFYDEKNSEQVNKAAITAAVVVAGFLTRRMRKKASSSIKPTPAQEPTDVTTPKQAFLENEIMPEPVNEASSTQETVVNPPKSSSFFKKALVTAASIGIAAGVINHQVNKNKDR